MIATTYFREPAIRVETTHCTVNRLSRLAYAQGFTHWHYRSMLPLSRVLEPQFFEHVTDLLQAGDTILISATDAGAQRFVVKEGDRMTLEPLR